MPHNPAMPVMLSAGERKVLKKRARGARTTYRDWLRAQIVLAAARGRASARIAAGLGISVDTVRKWRGRFAARGLDGLKDLPRPGRPRRISAPERAAVAALACQLPATTGVPLSRWTAPELAAELVTQGLVSVISPSSVLRILAEHPIKPWQYQSWVAENLVGALEGMDEAIPNRSSFTRARQRLGAGVIEAMFRRLAGPVAPAGLDGAFCGGCGWPRWTGSCSTCRTRWPTGPRSAGR